MKSKDSNLYFIAIIPNTKIVDELTEIKRHFANVYDSKASLNSLPHITLHMPFRWRDKKINLLHSTLIEISKSVDPFPVELKNFNCFEPKTIFVDVADNEKLNFLQYQVEKDFRMRLKLMNANYRDQAFSPHITLAFRDLSKVNFRKAWEQFRGRGYDSTFIAESVVLLKHNGEKWEIETEFPIGC